MKKKSVQKILAVDVGGTKTRVTLCEISTRGVIVRCDSRFPSTSHRSLTEILNEFLVIHSDDLRRAPIQAVAVGVPGPVFGPKIRLANLPWVVRVDEIAKRFRGCDVVMLNDLEAGALGMLNPSVQRSITQLDPRSRKQKKARLKELPASNCALVAPGTGLGEAILFWDGDRHSAAATEGGHCDFGPQNEKQIELLRWLWKRHAHASFEHVAAGSSIGRIYRFLTECQGRRKIGEVETAIAAGLDPTPTIVDLALESNPVCLETLDLWFECLGAECGNFAMTSNSRGGVYLWGAALGRVLNLLLRRKLFFQRYESKGRLRSLVENIPVYFINDPNLVIYGLCEAAQRAQAEKRKAPR